MIDPQFFQFNSDFLFIFFLFCLFFIYFCIFSPPQLPSKLKPEWLSRLRNLTGTLIHRCRGYDSTGVTRLVNSVLVFILSKFSWKLPVCWKVVGLFCVHFSTHGWHMNNCVCRLKIPDWQLIAADQKMKKRDTDWTRLRHCYTGRRPGDCLVVHEPVVVCWHNGPAETKVVFGLTWKVLNPPVCTTVCHNEKKKVPDEWQARQACVCVSEKDER